jgi:hypothetical protein
LLDVLGSGLNCPVVKVNRPELADLSIFIAQKLGLFKEKMETLVHSLLRDGRLGQCSQRRKGMRAHESVKRR